MSNVATVILLFVLFATGLVALYLAYYAASTPFAIHMGLIAAWSLAFIVWAWWRNHRPT